jgi:ribose transport system substrate-binding protein
MNRLRFLLSLITKENDYQMEQAAAAKSTAQELGLDLDILYAENDAITQSTQLLKVIQGNPSVRPAAIIVEPLGATAFTKVASAAVSAGMGWAVINREADYGANLRAASRATVFSIGPDQKEVGRIQARQIAVLLPRGGSVLYIQGPSVSSVSQQRYEGLMEELSASVKLVQLRGKWTEEPFTHSWCCNTMDMESASPGITRDDLSKLLDRPSCGRMIGHVEVSNLTCSYLHDYKHVENSKASCHDDEEIAG